MAEKVAGAWRDAGLEPRPGVDDDAIASFRLRNGAAIPQQLAEFYRVTNGLESDANHFAVWSLETVRRVPEALGEFRGSPNYGSIAETLQRAGEYLVFADYMIWSHVFAVQVSPIAGTLGSVLWICGSEFGVAAESFDTFWEKYLGDPLSAVVV